MLATKLEIIGYSYDAALHCLDCYDGRPLTEENEARPVFEGERVGGEYPFCYDCGEPLL